MRVIRLIVAIALLPWIDRPHVGTRVAAQTALRHTDGDDLRAANAFLGALKAAVARDDRRAVAAMVQYPIHVNTGTLRVPFSDAAALVERYDLIFSREMKVAIAGSRV